MIIYERKRLSKEELVASRYTHINHPYVYIGIGNIGMENMFILESKSIMNDDGTFSNGESTNKRPMK